MYAKVPTLAPVTNQWQMNTNTMGVYGDYYLKRAIIALAVFFFWLACGYDANGPHLIIR